MTNYLTAAELTQELTRVVHELAPTWAAAQSDLADRIYRALDVEPGDVMVVLSYEDFLERFVGLHAEWVDGKVIQMTPVSIKHQMITQFLVKLLDEYATANQLGIVLSAPFQMRLLVPPRGREPDILFVRSDHRTRLQPAYLEGPADLVVEVISPESIGRDRGEKYMEYAVAGVPEYWLIDPLTNQAEFYQLQPDRHYQVAAVDAAGWYASPALPGLRINTAWLWQDPPPSLLEVLRVLGITGW